MMCMLVMAIQKQMKQLRLMPWCTEKPSLRAPRYFKSMRCLLTRDICLRHLYNLMTTTTTVINLLRYRFSIYF
jgi:hypothetical protein